MKTLIIFFVTFLISFLGSIHPGPVNLSVIQAVVRKNLPTALWIGLGGALVEIPYSYLALQGVRYIHQYPGITRILQIGIILILFVLGITSLLRKPTTDVQETASDTQHLAFFKGVLLSVFNGQLPLYWFTIVLAYQSYDWLRVDTGWHQLGFLAGTFTGSLTLQMLYARMAERYQYQLLKHIPMEWMDRIIGGCFLAIAGWQLIQLIREIV